MELGLAAGVAVVVGLAAGFAASSYYSRALSHRLRALSSDLKTIRQEWENAWAQIDSAARRAVRYSRETRQNAPGSTIERALSPQDQRNRVLQQIRARRA